MSEEPNRTESDPATLLESDLAEIRNLLRVAVQLGSEEGRAVERRTNAMAAASRLFTGAIGATALIARLKGQNGETRHRIVVDQPARPAVPEPLSPRARRINAAIARYNAESEMTDHGPPAARIAARDTPDENSKTTACPRPQSPRVRS